MLRRPQRSKIQSLLRDQRGLTTVEYVIVLCLIAVVGFAVWQRFGQVIKDRIAGSTQVMEGLPTQAQ